MLVSRNMPCHAGTGFALGGRGGLLRSKRIPCGMESSVAAERRRGIVRPPGLAAGARGVGEVRDGLWHTLPAGPAPAVPGPSASAERSEGLCRAAEL